MMYSIKFLDEDPLDAPSPRLTEIKEVDRKQDELMAKTSADGAPPEHDLRLSEWRWAAIIVPPTVLIALGAASMSVGNPRAMLIGLAMIGVLALAAIPAWAAGLLRGREERIAHRRAVSHVRKDLRRASAGYYDEYNGEV